MSSEPRDTIVLMENCGTLFRAIPESGFVAEVDEAAERAARRRAEAERHALNEHPSSGLSSVPVICRSETSSCKRRATTPVAELFNELLEEIRQFAHEAGFSDGFCLLCIQLRRLPGRT
jgi:hypothetical protein